MTKKMFAKAAAALTLAAVLLMSGCGSAASAETLNTGSVGAAETGAVIAAAENGSASESGLFTERDLAQIPDLSKAKTLSLSDGQTVKVTEAGVYVLSGSAENAAVLVDAGDDDKVQLVLAGVSIVNTDYPCILVENADKVFITSAEGSENVLTVSGAFSGDGDAAVFSRDDLVLNGLGSVAVSSSKDGIRSGDSLKLTGGMWTVTASDSAVKAHDGIYVNDGVCTLTAGNDGLHAEDSEGTGGCIVLEGGSVTVSAGDDGVHANASVTVDGGTLTVSAAEGIEATQVVVNDGTVNITATDDGVNAGRKSDSLPVKVEINGGRLTVVMGPGDTDAIDSNGDLIITGGTIDITARSPFDYDGSCSYTGGKIIVNGAETNSVANQMTGGGMMGGPAGKQGGFGVQPGDPAGAQGGFHGKRW